MSNTNLEDIDPKDPKNKHLYYLYPYILYCRNFGPNSPATQSWDKELTVTFDFEENISKYVKRNYKEIANEFNARWITALCEAYIDCTNNSEERFAALILSSFIRQTQVATTHLYWRGGMHPEYIKTKEVHSIPDLEIKYGRTKGLWSGMHGVIGDDIYRNLFYRIKSSLKNTPVFDKFFIKVVRTLLIENTVINPSGKQDNLTKNTLRLIKLITDDIE